MTISRPNHHSFNVQFHFKSRPVLFNSGDLAVNKIKCISNIEQQLAIAPTQLKLECQPFFSVSFQTCVWSSVIKTSSQLNWH